MNKVLISTLGFTPGAVTGAYFALARNGHKMDEVVTVTTGSPLAKLCENLIDDTLQEADFDIVYKQERPTTKPTLSSLDDVGRFQDRFSRLLQDYIDRDYELFVDLSGGRKSMVASAVLAAQKIAFFMEEGDYSMRMFHVEVDEEIEERGHINMLITMTPKERERYLNPPADMMHLVDITALALEKLPTAEWSNLYEYAVGDFLSRDNAYWVRTSYEPHYLRNKKGLGEVDILAEPRGSGPHLVVECKLRTIDDPDRKPIRSKEVRQLANKLGTVAEEEGVQVLGRLYCNTALVDQDAWELAQEKGVELWVAKPTTGWRAGGQMRINNAELIQSPV